VIVGRYAKEVCMELKQRAQWITDRLNRAYPDARCALTFDGPWQLLVAAVLSAQCTDERVNQVTASLFRKYPGPEHMVQASLQELEEAVRPTGFYRNKAGNLKQCATELVNRHGGRVPDTLEELVKLPGVGRKTANLILGEAFGVPGVVVDTHVLRVSNRLGLSRNKDPEKVERDLMKLFSRELWTRVSDQLIWHGRLTCTARKPKCPECVINAQCDFYRNEYLKSLSTK